MMTNYTSLSCVVNDVAASCFLSLHIIISQNTRETERTPPSFLQTKIFSYLKENSLVKKTILAQKRQNQSIINFHTNCYSWAILDKSIVERANLKTRRKCSFIPQIKMKL